jgi:hypothetical protein
MLDKNSNESVLFVRHVPNSLKKQIRQKALEEDRSVGDLVIDALRMYVKRPSGAAPRLRER